MDTLENRIKEVSRIIEDLKYAKERARSPKSKRNLKNTLQLFSAILDDLKELQKLKTQ
tara:strand:+ start:342 stop:515 length:174 start_codon:yes stop_codon:yes gene_type:complete